MGWARGLQGFVFNIASNRNLLYCVWLCVDWIVFTVY